MNNHSSERDIPQNNDASDAVLSLSETATSPKGSEKLTIKDLLALTFSATDLIISGLSYYTSNIAVEDNAMARVVDFDIEPGDRLDSNNGYINGWVVAHIAYINAGNRPAVMIKSSYSLRGSNDTHPRIEFGDDMKTLPHTFPLVLPAHDARVIDLRIPIKHLVDNYDNGSPVPIAESPQRSSTDRAFAMRLRFDTLDSKGTVHHATSEDQGPIGVTKTGWAFGPGLNNAPILLLTGPAAQ